MKPIQFKIGSFYWTDGLDMDCRKYRVRTQLIRILDKRERDIQGGHYDCVTKSDGIKVYGNLSDLSEEK